MNVRPKGACDPCCNDWKMQIKELWEKYQEVVKTIEVNGERFYPDGDGLVKFETNTDVIDNTSYYTLICRIIQSTISRLIPYNDYWLLETQNIYDMDTYFDISESSSFTILNEGQNYLITATG